MDADHAWLTGSSEVSVNLFFAVLPDTTARDGIALLARHLRSVHGLHGVLIRPEHLHVSLCAVENFGRGAECAIRRAVDAAERVRIPPFDVAFDVAQSFRVRPGANPLVLRGYDDAEALAELRRGLGAVLEQMGLISRLRKDHVPHVTMLWADRCVEEHPVAPIRWTAQEFVLVLSLVGRAEHRHIARWPLKA